MSYRADKLVIDTRHTDRLTDTQMQATTIPEGQNWPRVKIRHFSFVFFLWLWKFSTIFLLIRRHLQNISWGLLKYHDIFSVNTQRAMKFQKISLAIFNVIQSTQVSQNQGKWKKPCRKQGQHYNQHCVCRWPRCWAICRHSDDHTQVLHFYIQGWYMKG